MKIDKFEDLIAWQESRKLVNQIYDITHSIKDFSLSNQIQRAAVSVMANISEGFGRYSFKDSKQFFTMARGSLAETQSHLYIMLDRKTICEDLFKKIYEQTVKINKLVNGLIRNLNSRLTREPASI